MKLTVVLSVALAVLAVALTAVLVKWHSDALHFRAALKTEAGLPKVVRTEESAAAALEQQRAQDVASLEQLRHDLGQANGQVKDLTAQLAKATASLTDQQKDYTALSAQFNDLRDREAKLASDESQYFELYSQSNQALVSQREYLRGLYVDDLALRKAAKEGPYGSAVSPAPPSVPGTQGATASTTPSGSNATNPKEAMDAPP